MGSSPLDWVPPESFDEYRLIKALGRGSMGQVWLAHDTVLDRLVAVKFIAEPPVHEAVRQRFLTEARAAARVQHPNIIAVYRVGEIGARPYLISEYVRGDGLDTIARPVAWPRLLEIAIGLARGLAAAHRQGVLHRDLKPANAILSEAGEVKLLDFGLAKLLPHVTPDPDAPPDGEAVALLERPAAPSSWPPASPAPFATPVDLHTETVELPASTPAGSPGGGIALRSVTTPGAVMGTPAYMSPEAWRGEPATLRSDVYSLGVMLYELGAGAPPRRGDPELASGSTLAGEPAPLAAVAPGIDPGFAAVVDRCLRHDPIERFASGDAVRDALDAIAARSPHELDAPGAALRRLDAAAPHRGRWWRRSLLAAGIAVAGASVALAVRQRVAPAAPAAPRIVVPVVDATALPAKDRWLGPVMQRLLADELSEAWGIEVDLAAAALPAPPTLLASAGLARDPSGQLRLAVDGTVLDGATVQELAVTAAARVVSRHVPIAARHPSAADLAAVGAHDAEAWRLWRRAEHETLLTRFSRASELCRQALARDPEFPIASLELALTYSNNDAGGVRELAHAAELMDRVPVRPLWRTALTGAQRLKDGNFLGAALTAQELLAMDLTPRERLWIQLRWLTARLYLGAAPASLAPELVVLTERYPDHPAAYKLLASMYLDSDEPTAPKLALRHASRAIELAPEDAEVRADLAIALLRTGRRDEARARLDEIDRLAPDDKRLAGPVLFTLHMAFGDLAEAELDAQRELAAGPRAQGVWHTARLDLYWGRFDAGLRRLMESAELFDATGASAWAAGLRYTAGRQALLVGDRDAALAAFERVAAGHTRLAAAAKIRVLIVAGKLDEARARAAALDGDSADRRNAELAIASAANDAAEVLAVFARIEPLSTTPEHLFAAADALDRSGQSDQAATMYQRLVDHLNAWEEPIATTRAWSRLGHLRERAGDTAGARAAYAEVVQRWGHATARVPEVDDARRRLRALHER
ncbi:MAG TPA: protein kinase [Kofleriaceae bacterium]|nr:protein kinase [Kofleriaceae bacterium]